VISGYVGIAPKGDLVLLQRLAKKLRGKRLLNVNSTRSGGGVAEILGRAMPIYHELGLDARWEVVKGDARFFETTKRLHNALQGKPQEITAQMWEHYLEVNAKNAGRLDLAADVVFVHDPQPAPLVRYRDGGKWVWRCHIDVSKPQPAAWERVEDICRNYDAAVFSVSKFARYLGLDQYVIRPSIDPLSEKNREMEPEEVKSTLERLGIPGDRPILLQVSRFDRFKDPVGVIRVFRMVRKYNRCILVLAGSSADDDPEGEAVLAEVREMADDDPDIYTLLLPPGSDREINALQRGATVILQKSLREGFGLTVAEAMWKGKPVIGGAVGGIPQQIVHGTTGFLVYSVEGAAFRVRQFLNNPEMGGRMGESGREHVRKNFLITRQVRDYLGIWYAMETGGAMLEV
jgi:trehalose synthase